MTFEPVVVLLLVFDVIDENWNLKEEAVEEEHLHFQ